MMFTNIQAVYFKEYLTLKNFGDRISRLSSSLFESKIKLNPHQINAALSFFKNPKKKGLILADEVGLGKTIEAGLIISQYFCENKKRILVICPASLMRQWNEELDDKFHLESMLLDSKTLHKQEFIWEDKIYIASINFVYLNSIFFKEKFDLIIIDEAHKLRNVYKGKGVISTSIKDTFSGQKKLLLSATPFQNNLMELFGLISILDENIFPDINVYKDRYINEYEENKTELKKIVSNYMVRTLRKDVVKYINYTKRNVIIADYQTTKKENEILEKISTLMYSDDFSEVYSTGQNQLLIILLQKLLSSSITAVKNTLTNIKYKLENNSPITIDDYSLLSENKVDNQLTIKNKEKLADNITTVINLINELTVDSKFSSLLNTINNIYDDFDKSNLRNRKILIFTESKQTQEYLYNKLFNSKYSKVIKFNGENNDSKSTEIYNKWLSNQKSPSKQKSINIRRALIDAFENDYEILIATDAAAEGLNMQFCSVIINYDLPWNPQKIEQRIGRCHRYGQKNDVIVINLLNTSSSIDQKIYELLTDKLGIFEETFGSSDTILGTTNIGENIENAIKNVYRKCRTPEEIENSFIELQKKFSKEIEETIRNSEHFLEKYFDTEVSKIFDLQYLEAKQLISEMEYLFYSLIKYVYRDANYNDSNYEFTLNNIVYSVLNSTEDSVFCSLSSDLGKTVINKINEICIPLTNSLAFNYTSSSEKIGYLDDKIGITGKMNVSKIIYESFETNESLIITAQFSDGTIIPQNISHKLLKLAAQEIATIHSNLDLNEIHQNDISSGIKRISEYNTSVFNEELKYIDNWADTMIERIQLEAKQLREKRKELQLQYDFINNIDEKANIQEEIHNISKKINKLWINLASAEDEVEDKRSNLINNLRAESKKSIAILDLFELEFIVK